MQTIISHSIPFKDIMKDFAREMGTNYSQSCNVYAIKIPKALGEGAIKGINFDEGIGLLMYDCLFYEETEIHFVLNVVHPLKFMFCEEGDFRHCFQDSKEDHQVERLQNIIVASSELKGHIIKFKASVHTKINNLEVNRERFYEVMKCEINRMKPGLKGLFKDVKGKNYFYRLGNYSLKMANIFLRLAAFEGSPFAYNLFIHSKSYEIFLTEIQEYWDNSSEKEVPYLLKRELELIYKASLYIDADVSRFKSVKHLAQHVGLNSNKLQDGFKEVYGKTVNAYVQSRRIDEASILVKNTNFTFAEIADKIGIRSKSYFSKIFKDKYGLTPSEIRENYKNTDLEKNGD